MMGLFKGVSGPTLVLQKFKYDQSATDGVLVNITGRSSGFIAWLLTNMGLDVETNLTVKKDHVIFKSSSLAGETNTVAPLACIASTNGGFIKSLGLFFFAVALIISSLISLLSDGFHSGFFAPFIIGCICFIMYYFSKTMTLSLETSGGNVLGIKFKRGLIENVPIEMDKVMEVINIINKQVIESQIK